MTRAVAVALVGVGAVCLYVGLLWLVIAIDNIMATRAKRRAMRQIYGREL